VRHTNGEMDGRCRDCLVDRRAGGDWPVCTQADPDSEEPPALCAWCGHLVTTSAGAGQVPAVPAPVPSFGEVRR
jgi:hypothetical protein